MNRGLDRVLCRAAEALLEFFDQALPIPIAFEKTYLLLQIHYSLGPLTLRKPPAGDDAAKTPTGVSRRRLCPKLLHGAAELGHERLRDLALVLVLARRAGARGKRASKSS